MKPISELMGSADRGAVTRLSSQSKQWQNSYEQPGTVSQRSIAFWAEMMGIYSDKWRAKNGMAPSLRWNQVITALTNEQLQGAIDACVRRCCNGNQFAPDLAEFMGIVSCEVNNPFRLTAGDVMAEFKRYCREKYLFSCAETFDWKQPVLYHICCALRSEMVQRNLNDAALEKRADVHLKAWSDKVIAGGEVTEPKPLLSEKTSRPKVAAGFGHTAAMEILAKLRRSKPQTN